MKTIFFVGGTFFDRTGSFTVTRIDPNGDVQICYEDHGEIAGVPETILAKHVGLRERIHQNVMGDANRKHLTSSAEYFWTLGFLAKNARFKAELPEHTVDGFTNNYVTLTGAFPKDHEDIRYEYNPDIWGPGLRIIFRKPEHELDFGQEVEEILSGNVVTVSRNKLWLKLIGLGFRLGTEHKVDQIRASILDKKNLAFFEAGYNFSLTA